MKEMVVIQRPERKSWTDIFKNMEVKESIHAEKECESGVRAAIYRIKLREGLAFSTKKKGGLIQITRVK